jgi:hypothetical protein
MMDGTAYKKERKTKQRTGQGVRMEMGCYFRGGAGRFCLLSFTINQLWPQTIKAA